LLDLLARRGCVGSFDDVLDYEAIRSYLPPSDPRFRVLLTTRLRLGASINKINMDVLKEAEALMLLQSLIGVPRIQKEIDCAKEIYQWFGGLPLGLELLGDI
jgi:hypothetical protein